MMSRARTTTGIGALCVACALGACSGSQGGSTPLPAHGLPSDADLAALPMGHIAGNTDSDALARSIANPYAGNAQAIAGGAALYTKMNCAGCHGYKATGGMGPDLTDSYWRYGGYPAQVYRSIHDGRAQGMPAWGAALPETEIWKLVAYIQSLGGTFAVDAGPSGSVASPSSAPHVPSSWNVPSSAPAQTPKPAQEPTAESHDKGGSP